MWAALPSVIAGRLFRLESKGSKRFAHDEPCRFPEMKYPPVSNTLPSASVTDRRADLGEQSVSVRRIELPATGSKISTEFWILATSHASTLTPPAKSTRPSGSRLAVKSERTVVMLADGVN